MRLGEPIRTEIDRERVSPASRWNVLLWLITGGRYGKVYRFTRVKEWQWSAPPEHYMCRSAVGRPPLQSWDDMQPQIDNAGKSEAEMRKFLNGSWELGEIDEQP